MSDERDAALIDRIARIAGRLGFNETRVRWRLLAWKSRREEASSRAGLAASHVGYRHAVCGNCGRILPRDTRECPTCGAVLEPRWVQMLRRARMHVPFPLSVTALIGAVILVAFLRQVAATGAFMGFPGEVLLALGAHAPWLERSGQWWRLGTAVLLHGGLVHAAFNLVALSQVGPATEETFGPGRTLAFFTFLGAAANVPSLLIGREAMGVGASGAVLGLAGLAAGWGHREGTTNGRRIRNSMLMWLLYSTLFGLAFHVDHLAHFGGFLAGAALGWGFHGVRKSQGAADAAFGIAGFLALAALLALVIFPPEVPGMPGLLPR